MTRSRDSVPSDEARQPGATGAPARDTVLIFTRTAGYRHESIPAGTAALAALAASAGLVARATEDPDMIAAAQPSSCAAVVFLSTTGTVLTPAARTALEGYVRGGGGFLGVHSAAGTEYEWPFYGELLGARFAGHPALQPGVVNVVDRTHPATSHLPTRWQWTDEWYDFDALPAPGSRILATIDEGCYEGGGMSAGRRGGTGEGDPREHPLAWCREIGRGRSLYTSLGHGAETYADPDFRAHLLGALLWTARLR
jgi:hypothetical protein